MSDAQMISARARATNLIDRWGRALQMATNKRITDLTDYTSVLPYSSEMFGVYQPMIGWKSKRLVGRLQRGLMDSRSALLRAFAKTYDGNVKVRLSPTDCSAQIQAQVGQLSAIRPQKTSSSILVQHLLDYAGLPKDKPPAGAQWDNFINRKSLTKALDHVTAVYSAQYKDACTKLHTRNAQFSANLPTTSSIDLPQVQDNLVSTVTRQINEESALAGALTGMVAKKMFAQLEALFYKTPTEDQSVVSQQIAAMLTADDPFAIFDPKHDIQNVSLSPLGIVHLFRQYFYELDTFLGTPTGHVWLSPGSVVELIEVSTRRVYIEKIIEQSIDTTRKTESSSTTQDDISGAVKEDNKSDLKLGASLTVNQSWGTGNATATGSLNMDQTQGTARENTHKRMRQQTSKLSTEIRENYKSTFKTVTETTDTSNKKYVLENKTPNLINYELRRKMRQVGVQVQDIGTYLCWEGFVDEPGRQLGLANMVHIAQPADLVTIPDQTNIPLPPDTPVPFTGNVTWNFGDDNRQFNDADGFRPIGVLPVPPAPDGYEVKFPNGIVEAFQVTASGNDFSGVWGFRGKLLGTSNISVGPYIGPDGMEWDDIINFAVGGVVWFTPTLAKRNEIAAENAAKNAAGKAATAENERKAKDAFLKAAKERIEFASGINSRKYEDLREEERIVVYRKMIEALMSDTLYGMPESTANDEIRHTLSELVNSIFDIDKMLYFVAPEWWKPRRHYHQYLGAQDNYSTFTGNLTSWSDLEVRPDNYYITERSQAARMGSSLGWLLQLDGDDLRSAFLNAPWVKAVIPIRPGRELEAMNWLQQMHIEGTDGLDADYHAPPDELKKIQDALLLGQAKVTIADAIRFLCAEVAAKHEASLKVGRYPKEEINDDNRVSATPVDKVYEHGFYPLTGGFRAITGDPFEVFDQWIEVLPTDQVVPVEVKYNPKTGRQVP
jgi:hypothetical protein